MSKEICICKRRIYVCVESIVETKGRLGAASAVLPETRTISVYGFFPLCNNLGSE